MNAVALPDTERRREAPEQSAGQLVWLTVATVIAGLPHYAHMAPWIPPLALGVAGWRIHAAVTRRGLPGTWLRIPLTLLVFAAVVVTYRQVSGLDAGSALLLVMVSLKLLETRGSRDRAVVVFMCYFLLFAAFLRDQPLWSGLWLIAGVLVTTASLLQIARENSVIAPREALAEAGSLMLQAAPLMLLLFLLFPRVPGPFWALPERGGSSVSGLPDDLSPGDLTQLALSDEVAFRVEFDGDIPTDRELYWRGPVLTRFDGRTWTVDDRDMPPPDRPLAEGTVRGYRITLEPHQQRWLLALESPLTWDHPGAMLTGRQQLVSSRPIDQRIAYRARSLLTERTAAAEPDWLLTENARLPKSSNARATAYARELRAGSRSARDYLDRVMSMFREQPFYYTLQPPALGNDAVDEFLFDSRRGFCSHYASAFALLARAAGLPARVVTGYQGGEINRVADYLIVRQANAHAWTEVWLDSQWQRYDPTMMIAPERIEADIAESRGGAFSGDAPAVGDLFVRLAMTWDAANAVWNDWVLAYGPDSQAALLAATGIERPSTRHLIIALLVTAMSFLAVLAWLFSRGDRPPRDSVSRAWDELCRRLALAARARDPAEGPDEYARAVATLRPDLSNEVRSLIGMYTALRYDGDAEGPLADRFETAVRAFRPEPLFRR